MAVYENSRYLRTQLIQRSGWKVPTIDIRERFKFNSDKFQVYEWVEGDTLDGVSYKFYNNTALRWAILDANPQYLTEFDIQNGDKINIPDYEEVVDYINV